MKTDHQDSRIPNELLIGQKLEGGSKMNGKTITGVQKIRLRQFSVEKNLKNVVKCLQIITSGVLGGNRISKWSNDIDCGNGVWRGFLVDQNLPPPIYIRKNKGSN